MLGLMLIPISGRPLNGVIKENMKENIICKLENREVDCFQNGAEWNPLEWIGISSGDFKVNIDLNGHLYVYITRQINEQIGKEHLKAD